jgi:flavin reductase (DIM6/NTAB) family NADH-FMN oxidoreductase RutF
MEAGMTEEELAAAFEAGRLGADEFPHAGHVRVAAALARTYGASDGLERLIAGVRGMATRAGRPDAYHVTITRAWFELIASIEDIAEHEELFDKTLLDRYYSPERLIAGREQWLDPDLHPLRLPAPDPRPTDLAFALRRIPTAVAVLATRVDHTVHATTVSSIASVSRRPPLVSVCLATGSRTLELLGRADAFTLSVLASDQGDIVARFANRDRPTGAAQFADTSHQMSPFGPVLDGAVVRLGCELHTHYECGDHHIVVGAVRSADATADVHPLLRHNGVYRVSDAIAVAKADAPH